MSEIEVYEGHDAPATISPVSEREFALIMRQAEVLATAPIIPAAYRRQPANIVVAALTGRSFGWDVLTAVRNGHVIEGTWSLKPEAMLGLVRRAGHSVTGSTSPEGATVTGKRRDTGDELTVTFTMADAQRAGLANKGTWKQYPQSMCWARAISQLCRMLFADVTLGLSYTPEELGAEVTEDGEIIDVPAIEESPYIGAENVKAISDKAGALVADVILLATEGRTEDPAQLLKTEVPAARDALDALTKEDPDAIARLAFLRDDTASAPAEEQANGPEVGNGNGTQDRDSSGPGSRTRKAAT